MHGGGISKSRKPKRRIDSDEVIRTSGRILVPRVVDNVATIHPAIMPIYTAYKLAKVGKDIYDIYIKSENKNEVVPELVRYAMPKFTESLMEGNASQIAKDVRATAGSVITDVSSLTKIDEDIYGSMLEGSIKDGLISGLGSFTSYAIENYGLTE